MRLASRVCWKGEVVLDKLRIRDIMVNLLSLPAEGSSVFTQALGDAFGDLMTKADGENIENRLATQIARGNQQVMLAILGVGGIVVALLIAILAVMATT